MSRRKYLSQYAALILAGEAIFLLPFVIPRVFRNTLLEVYQIDNIELSYCFSIYGLVAIASYFFGGPLADLVPSRKLMAGALGLTAIGGFILAISPSFQTLLWVYGFWGFSTIFLFWAALMKSTRILVNRENEAKAFGWVEGGRGLSSALWASLAVLLFNWFFIEEARDLSESRNGAYQYVLFAGSIVLILVAAFTFVVLPKKEPGVNIDHSLQGFQKLLKNKGLWLQALIVLLAYCAYKLTDDLSLYAHEVWGLNEKAALAITSKALYLRPIAAVLAGIAADRFKASRVLLLCFGSGALGAFLLSFEGSASYSAFSLIWFGIALAGIYGLRGIYIALMRENAVPRALSGTAVGIISVVGYLPDVFMSPLMGYILENKPGAEGHYDLFRLLAGLMVAGFLVALIWERIRARQKESMQIAGL